MQRPLPGAGRFYSRKPEWGSGVLHLKQNRGLGKNHRKEPTEGMGKYHPGDRMLVTLLAEQSHGKVLLVVRQTLRKNILWLDLQHLNVIHTCDL